MSPPDVLATTFCDAPDCSERIRVHGDRDERDDVVAVNPAGSATALDDQFCSPECAIRGLADGASTISHVAIHTTDTQEDTDD